ncbi:NAD dependent epimerase/dehydratase [Schizosaccharomyces cryophilus OY26]|uniref:NAD dependent epimerase/dehydratase n=1 Tax=Schizosaccharomyces cryophilus (strain OY26 / ATCC MYA-4695 / CBS 11777 / NBRC 106824 / NRRL Y48691) TaxID=653667 RepID=S9VZE1_SCHCR|nr:NAD dependent epimerase/dehydratase [Schizosaccharomyces cryophilus OY26]EPY51170.1 NAD dependent epimerase/dehydratase [Schizosaccharomyces cryophilus OY26]
MKLVVLGGSGFLGHNICKLAIARGHQVVSVSRRGRGGIQYKEPWMEKVHWEKVDAMKEPHSLLPIVQDASAVVNTVGILMESNYKQALENPRGSILQLVKNLRSNVFQGSENPLKKPPSPSVPPAKPNLRFETINRDLAINTANIAAEAHVPVYCYISAHASVPGLDPRYISTKREAEQAISKIPNMRSIFVRPTFMYDTYNRPISGVFAPLLKLSSGFNHFCSGFFDFLGAASAEPLPTSDVAKAALEAILDPSKSGPLGIQEIKDLANRASSSSNSSSF